MFSGKRKWRDFSAEIEAHIALETDPLCEQGYSQAEGRYAARRAFGNVGRTEERFHESTRWVWWDNLSADIRYAFRGLLKAPGFTLAVLATLALGIGANTAIFTVINTVLLRPLPYPDSNRIVNISRPGVTATMPMFTFWQQNNPGFLDLTAYQPGINLNLTGGDKPQPIGATIASQNYFRLFGANPILGRTFSAEEDRLGGPKVVVMSYALWQQRFAGDRAILGKTISLSGTPYRVIGVLSPTFKPNPPTDAWVPLQTDPHSTNQAHVLIASGRLPPGVTLAQAGSWMTVLGKRYVHAHPEQLGNDDDLRVSLMQRKITGDVQPFCCSSARSGSF